MSGEVREIFRRYAWPGNIRELRNLAEYFCFTGSPVITVEDLPPTFMYEKNIQGWEGTAQAPVSEGAQAPDLRQAGAPDEFEAASPWQQAMEKRGIEAEEYWFVLETLYQAYGERQPAGRDGILEKARAEKVYLSQIGVRNIMGI